MKKIGWALMGLMALVWFPAGCRRFLAKPRPGLRPSSHE